MGINIRTKGADGERQICEELNGIVYLVHQELGYPYPAKPKIQRNQNQSAVGGSDITNPYGFCIEVKRQEALSINTWWKQCVKAAEEFGGVPVLVFRQNRGKWRVITLGGIVHSGKWAECRVEIEWETFRDMFKRVVIAHELNNPTGITYNE